MELKRPKQQQDKQAKKPQGNMMQNHFFSRESQIH